MSEAPGLALGPHTTLETGTDPAQATDRREMLAAALDASEGNPEVSGENPEKSGENPDDSAAAPVAAPEPQPWDAPPTSWKKEQHAHWAGASPELRQYITARENEMRAGIEPLIPKAKFADEIERTIQPYQANIQAAGVPPVTAIQTLMQADHILRNAPQEQKRAYARQLLQQYGVDLSGEDWTPQEGADPRLQALQNELAAVRNTVATWQQQQAQTEHQQITSEIDTFAQGREHFEALRPAMSKLMLSGVAVSLEDAYNKALRLDDDLFSATQASQQAAAAAEKKAAADQAAKAARAAAVSARSSSPGGAPTTKAQDRRAMLEDQFNGLNARL